MLCAKFGWNWPSGSWEGDENVKSLQTDGRIDDGQKVIRKAHLSFQLRWAKKLIKYFQYNCTILLLSPPEKGHNPLFKKVWILSTQECFVSSFNQINSVVLELNFFLFSVRQYNFPNPLLSLASEKSMALHLHKLESPPSTDTLCQVWFKIA